MLAASFTSTLFLALLVTFSHFVLAMKLIANQCHKVGDFHGYNKIWGNVTGLVSTLNSVSVCLCQCVDVQPNDGFGTILPQETVSLDLIFSASKPRGYNFDLTCLTHLNRYHTYHALSSTFLLYGLVLWLPY